MLRLGHSIALFSSLGVALAFGQSTEYHSGLDVAKMLGSIGYTFKATGENSTSGQIRQGKSEASVKMTTLVGDRTRGTVDRIFAITVEAEFEAPRPIDPDEAAAWAKARTPKLPFSFTPHIGDTVTEHVKIELDTAKPEAIKAMIDAFFVAGKDFAKAHGFAYVPAKSIENSQRKFDDQLSLNRADRLSFERVIGSWGWASKKPMGYTSQGWMMRLDVNGKDIWVRQGTDKLDALKDVIEIVQFANEPAPSDYWEKAQASGEAMPVVIYDETGAHLISRKVSVNLEKNASLGELRKLIASFAASS